MMSAKRCRRQKAGRAPSRSVIFPCTFGHRRWSGKKFHTIKAYEAHSLMLIGMKVDPELDPLREEARFQDVLKKWEVD